MWVSQVCMGCPKIRKLTPRALRWAAIESPYGPAPMIATSQIVIDSSPFGHGLQQIANSSNVFVRGTSLHHLRWSLEARARRVSKTASRSLGSFEREIVLSKDFSRDQRISRICKAVRLATRQPKAVLIQEYFQER